MYVNLPPESRTTRKVRDGPAANDVEYVECGRERGKTGTGVRKIRKEARIVAERVPTSALNRRSGDIIDRAAQGAVIELTRHGRPVAIVMPSFEGAAAVYEAAYTMATGNSAAVAVTVSSTQADQHIATSPQLRPAKAAEPVQAKTAQQQRDDLLRGARRGKP
jgi:prevent-host-death family protein